MSWEAKPPPPTPPQLTVRPQRASPVSSCFRRQGCHPAKRSNGDFQLSKCILRHQFLINSSNIFYHCKQCSCWCFQKLLISIMVYPAQSPETVPAPKPSCWFIFAGMWLFVYNYVSADSWVGFAEKFKKKEIIFKRDGEALKSFRIYRCHPVYTSYGHKYWYFLRASPSNKCIEFMVTLS